MAKRMTREGVVPPRWQTLSTHAVLWHGCIDLAAKNIEATGVNLTKSRPALDFGRGFYTTTKRDQAVEWAKKKPLNLPPAIRSSIRPAIVEFRVPLDRLARLDSLMFVRGDAGHVAFWGFVHHCRTGTRTPRRAHLHPARTAPDDWYDVVCGPLAAVWPPHGRETIADSDQFSFHTAAGIAILNDVVSGGPPGFTITVL